jgi:hypothetical protein
MNGAKFVSNHKIRALLFIGYTCREKTMGVFMSEETEREDHLLLICVYCKRFKNEDGYWEHSSAPLSSVPENRLSHGMCPQCVKEHYPDQYKCLCKEGKIEVKEKYSPDNTLANGSLLIVNNTGRLYGEYNKEQRI